MVKLLVEAIILIAILLAMSGCAVIGTGTIGEAVYISLDADAMKARANTSKNYLLKQDGGMLTNDKKYTIEDVKAEWGEPYKINIQGDKTELTYVNGLRWKGIIVIPLVPIPIAIPVGQKTVVFEFKENVLDRWIIHGTHYCFSITGFNFIPVVPVGTIAESDCQFHQSDMNLAFGEMYCSVPFYDKCYPSTPVGRLRGNALEDLGDLHDLSKMRIRNR